MKRDLHEVHESIDIASRQAQGQMAKEGYAKGVHLHFFVNTIYLYIICKCLPIYTIFVSYEVTQVNLYI